MPVFACPTCSAVFQILPDADEFLCPAPHCHQRMRRPPAAGATLLATSPTVYASPDLALADRIRLLRVRVWAAAVRDREGVHANVSPECPQLAALVCNLLDSREALAAGPARASVDSSLAVLVGLMVLAGVKWVPELAA